MKLLDWLLLILILAFIYNFFLYPILSRDKRNLENRDFSSVHCLHESVKTFIQMQGSRPTDLEQLADLYSTYRGDVYLGFTNSYEISALEVDFNFSSEQEGESSDDTRWLHYSPLSGYPHGWINAQNELILETMQKIGEYDPNAPRIP